jgi:F1F0 ATPase subunit 2
MALDQDRMSINLILGLIGYLVLGLIVGGVYFTAMWWSAELFAAGGRMTLALALVAGRLVLIVAVLALVATQHGALPLLATAFGIVSARIVAVRRVKALAT